MTTYFFAYDMSNQQWLRIAEYINYLPSRYVFTFSFVSLTKYAGRKIKTVMWLRMTGKNSCLHIVTKYEVDQKEIAYLY